MQICGKLFKQFIVKDKVSIGGLELFPVEVGLLAEPKNIKSLPELYDQGSVIIAETSESGAVEVAHVSNLSEWYLFIMDGEALIGAKQNRIAQKSTIVPPHSQIDLPVNCVEQARWSSGVPKGFSRGNFSLTPNAREKKATLMKNKMDFAIQRTVWDSVEQLSTKHASFSATSDLGEIINSSLDITASLSSSDVPEIECNGFVVFGAGRPFVELFYSKNVCKLHQMASRRAWLADVEEASDSDRSKQDAGDLLIKLAESNWAVESPVGYETAFSSDEKHAGRFVLKDDAFVHGYFYA